MNEPTLRANLRAANQPHAGYRRAGTPKVNVRYVMRWGSRRVLRHSESPHHRAYLAGVQVEWRPGLPHRRSAQDLTERMEVGTMRGKAW
jgi:hypothetical protein